MEYPQIAFDLSPDDSELVVFFAGQRKGVAPISPPAQYILGEEGNPILDESGNPILAE